MVQSHLIVTQAADIPVATVPCFNWPIKSHSDSASRVQDFFICTVGSGALVHQLELAPVR